MADVQKALDEGANPNRIINRVVYYMANTCGQLSTLGCNSNNNIIFHTCTSVLFMPDTHTPCTCTLHACIHTHNIHTYTFTHAYPPTHILSLPSVYLPLLYLWIDNPPRFLIIIAIIFLLQTRRTPMLEACQRGHTEIAKLLLSRGADPNWRARVNTIIIVIIIAIIWRPISTCVLVWNRMIGMH